ncbi:hypothetical protein D9615_007249 [Tricholomella constricta]|uniref:OPT oligopeptide transporter n=1 Tax=Tricholomella constricta TaxID=117010 RepID=A0A8H5H553_9AGAR|nr:hypothetical protein D9615_007249 [Tricholomella constricta]
MISVVGLSWLPVRLTMTDNAPHYTLRQERRVSQASRSDEKHADEAAVKHLDDSEIAAITGAQFVDPNLDKDHLAFEDESPYPEVRSAVANTDDPDMPVSTLRSWIIGIMWAVLIPGVNQFFFFRFPSVTVTGIVAQLLSFPVGRAAAAVLPNWSIFGISLNPGPFTVKEHVLITIMATVGYQSAYATDIVAVQRVYYNQIYNFSYQWFIVMSTQLIGFSIGGVARRFLVAPPSMIWPINLVNCALFNTLHSTQYAGIGTRGGLSRERFFVYAFIGSFSWYFFPGYIFQALSYFSWVTWIRPEDPTTLVHAFLYFRKQIWVQARRALSEQPDIHARLMSRYPQVPEWWYLIIFLSMFALGVISIEVWPSEMPVWAFVLALLIGMPLSYHAVSIVAITNQQVGLNVITELIIGYALPGRPVAMMLFKTWGYITMAQALAFTSDFKLGHYMKGEPHNCSAPDLALYSLICSPSATHVHMPATVIAGTTQLGVQAWMFTNIEYVGSSTSHRPNLRLVAEECVNQIKEIALSAQVPKSSVPQVSFGVSNKMRIFQRANLLWYVYTTEVLQFGRNIDFTALVYFFLIGAVAPFIPWLLSKKYPDSFLKYINPVIFNGTGLIPPATAINYVPWAAVGFIFQYLIRRRHFSWWTKYNYVLSAALDSGVAVCIILIFFALQFPKNGTIGATTLSSWWG